MDLVRRVDQLASEIRTSRLVLDHTLAEAQRQLGVLRSLVADTRGLRLHAVPAAPERRPTRRRHARRRDHPRDQDVILDHIGLAHSLAARYASRGEELEDLRQVAMLGLVKAARRFDAGRGVRFSTYATASIVGEIKRHFRDKRWGLHVPRADQDLYLRVRDATDGLSTILGRSATVEEIADRAGVSAEDVVLAQELATLFELRSLDAVQSKDGTRTIDIGEKDASFELIESRVNLLPALRALTDDDRELILLRFRDGLTQSEIGQRLGVSQMQVSRMLAATLSQLRARIGA